MQLKIQDIPESHKFVAEQDGEKAIIEYILMKDKIYLTHTEVPDRLRGGGLASGFVKLVLEDIERRKLKLMPLCPFVAGYIRRHPEWKRLLMEGVNV